ncbi:PREDICTED: probable 4-coumarate--CoA ligase 3 isoform X2 [Branchiostoma belcheri]|uniref:Luciferin 4-monooxygenase n=1 Tax=Branchiostoma belcheri TaxID=7741 RepID=A0A6P5AK66_BRABE|nr:PREDICTED: probable 4-coumarate--CoA ligase 3 isoform X2 [Branchiostoma belcheri]
MFPVRVVLTTVSFRGQRKLLQTSRHFSKSCLLKTSQVWRSNAYLGQLASVKRCLQRCHLSARGLSGAAADRIVHSSYPDVHIPDKQHLTEFVLKDFDQYGDNVAMVDGPTGRSYTFSELKDLIRRLSSALTRLGFKQQDVLALYSPNLPEYAIVLFAVTALGGIVTTVNPLYTVGELTNQVTHSGAQYIVTIADFAENARKAKSNCPNVKDIYIIGGTAEGCKPLSDLLADDGSAMPSDVKIDPHEDIAMLPYSSGTTGLPKGVMLTHYSIIANLCQNLVKGVMLLDREEECLIGQLPFFHIYGLVVILFNCLMQGVRLVTVPRFEPESFLACVQNYKVTRILTVPPVAVFLAKHPIVDNYDLSLIKEVFCGAAPMGTEITMALMDRLKIPNHRQGYGLTETSPIVTIGREGVFVPGSFGVLVPNTKAKVIDTETGEAVGPGEDGELCVLGPQVMKGYYNNPEATANTIDPDGWLRTGDIVRYDEDGNFYAVDRVKELIKYKGFQVAPAELEAVLLGHPGVQDAAVIGLPDDVAGELPKAFIVKKSDAVTEKDITDFVTERVAPYKKLRGGVVFIGEIPKTPSGKILRRMLKDVKE